MNNTIASLTAPPELRGRFMSLMSAVNQAACAVGVFVASRVLMSAASGRILNMDKFSLYAVATTILGPILVGALLLRRPTNAVPIT